MDFKTIYPGGSIADAVSIRYAVFSDEQGFSREGEVDSTDSLAHHIVGYANGKPVATGRIFKENGVWYIGRVAILREHRGGGSGRSLMDALEALGCELGATEITLGAQCQAEGFYSRLGYSVCGDIYMDEHCPHIYMKKELRKR